MPAGKTLSRIAPANVLPLLDGPAMLSALLASGMSRWEAVGMVAGAHWARAVRSLWQRYAARVKRLPTLLRALDQVALGSPQSANAWLGAWLLEHNGNGSRVLANRAWITSLPEGLVVQGGLSLWGSGLIRLPDHLKIGGDLVLDGCALAVLPAGLEVGAYLWLRACPAWDGQIPADTRVGSRVFTSAHPGGLALAEWRLRHPHGETGLR